MKTVKYTQIYAKIIVKDSCLIDRISPVSYNGI